MTSAEIPPISLKKNLVINNLKKIKKLNFEPLSVLRSKQSAGLCSTTAQLGISEPLLF